MKGGDGTKHAISCKTLDEKNYILQTTVWKLVQGRLVLLLMFL
jgi:hypothetical protein